VFLRVMLIKQSYRIG